MNSFIIEPFRDGTAVSGLTDRPVTDAGLTKADLNNYALRNIALE